MPDRLCCPVDAYMLVARGGKLLMLRRAAGAAYAVAGLLNWSTRGFAGTESLNDLASWLALQLDVPLSSPGGATSQWADVGDRRGSHGVLQPPAANFG